MATTTLLFGGARWRAKSAGSSKVRSAGRELEDDSIPVASLVDQKHKNRSKTSRDVENPQGGPVTASETLPLPHTGILRPSRA
ncbi:hypothetical protein [Sphingomonas prati]|uniref:Uncharacterized protein n=1 Tax=Sphingomonas prati TaxID=1843237 RepID=A0A7W9BPX7_9SPHN|nr:hypothetical protein [Sphingomonas prati]MBB5727934.1 hypothetical protein [Sphingomonas prati]